jgi:hypothetical protein
MRQLFRGSPTTRFTCTKHSDIVRPASSSRLTQVSDRVRSFGDYNTPGIWVKLING